MQLGLTHGSFQLPLLDPVSTCNYVVAFARRLRSLETSSKFGGYRTDSSRSIIRPFPVFVKCPTFSFQAVANPDCKAAVDPPP
jgi:hypothetical protein